MKKITFVLLAYLLTIPILKAQQPLTIAPGVRVNAPTTGASGLKLTNLTSSSSATTTPTKVLSVDASGNVILSTAPTGGGSAIGAAVNVPAYANQTAIDAIASPTAGMLAYNTALSKLAYRTTAWNTFGESFWVRRLAPASSDIYYDGGRVRVGSASSLDDGATFTVTSQSASFTVPHLMIKNTLATPINILRFSGASPAQGSISQVMTINNTPNSATLVWNHVTNGSGGDASTPIASLTGDGDFTVNGFSKLGGSGTDVPALKTKIITGTLSNSATANNFAHGLNDITKIVGVVAIVGSSTYYYAGDGATGYTFQTRYNSTNVSVNISQAVGEPAPPLLNNPCKIFIYYVQ
jgi:hypothetical protein